MTRVLIRYRQLLPDGGICSPIAGAALRVSECPVLTGRVRDEIRQQVGASYRTRFSHQAQIITEQELS